MTVVEGVPTMYSAMLHHPQGDATDASSLQACVSGGAAMPVEVLRAFEAKFGCEILEGYGLSETSPVASFNRLDRRKRGSIGTADRRRRDARHRRQRGRGRPGEVGEVAIRGHNVMKGYWQLEQATAEAIDPDGWFKTGDMAKIDEDGLIFIVDRKTSLSAVATTSTRARSKRSL